MAINKRKRSAITRPMNKLRSIVDGKCRNQLCPFFLNDAEAPVSTVTTCDCLDEARLIVRQLEKEIGGIK